MSWRNLLCIAALSACAAPVAEDAAQPEAISAADNSVKPGIVGELVPETPWDSRLQTTTTSAADALTFKEAALIEAGVAYRSNVVMKFGDAETAYRETALARLDRLKRSTVGQAELELYLALNKSNAGEVYLAEKLFDKPRKTIEEQGAILERLRADVFFAQHFLNKGEKEESLRLAEIAIEAGTRSLAGLPELQDGSASEGEPIVEVARISPETSLDLTTPVQQSPESLLNIGKLTLEHKIKVLTAQAHYVAAASKGFDVADQKLPHLSEASDLLEDVPENNAVWLRAEVARSIALAVAETEGSEPAASEATRAVNLARKFAATERPEVINLLLRARLLLDAGQQSAAMSSYRAAVDILARGGRGVSFDELVPYIRILADQPPSSGRDEDLFLAVQQIKNPVATGTLSRLASRLASGTSDSAKAIRAFQDTERETNRLSARLDVLSSTRPRDVHALAVARSQLASAKASKEELSRAVESLAPNFVQVTDSSVSLSEFRKSLRSEEVFLQIRAGSTGAIVLAVTASEFRIAELDGDVAEIARLVAAIRENIYGDNFDVGAARDLYNLTLDPVDDLVKASRSIVFAPDGPLLALPPAVLVSDDPTGWLPGTEDYTRVPWLGTQKALSVALSASSFYTLRQAAPSQASIPFHGYGGFIPVGSRNAQRIADARQAPAECLEQLTSLTRAPALEGTVEEVQRLSRVAARSGSAFSIGKDFTDTELKAADLSDVRVLHFATHGLLPMSAECLPEPALTTSLGGPESDGLLDASEVVDLKLDAELVVLSACDTGGYGANSGLGTGFGTPGGEALSGLVRAFFYAGARSVIASHWQIPDAQTVDLMERFYETHTAGVALDEAMRQSRQSLAGDFQTSHPFYWAAFTITGGLPDAVDTLASN